MNYAYIRLNEIVKVTTINQFFEQLNALDHLFFETTFFKSKAEYVAEISRLLDQINNDYHFVAVLKQEKYRFQLNWKESVLKAHLQLLLPRFAKNALQAAV